MVAFTTCRLPAVCALVLLVAGCAAPSFLRPEGLRQATVVRIYAPVDASRADAPQCLAAADPATLAAGRYVQARYRGYRSQRSTLAVAPPAITPRVGDRVEVELEDCTRGTPSMITRRVDRG